MHKQLVTPLVANPEQAGVAPHECLCIFIYIHIAKV